MLADLLVLSDAFCESLSLIDFDVLSAADLLCESAILVLFDLLSLIEFDSLSDVDLL